MLLFVLWDNKGLHQGCKILLSHTMCNKVHIAPLSNVAGALLSVVAYIQLLEFSITLLLLLMLLLLLLPCKSVSPKSPLCYGVSLCYGVNL